MGHERIPAAGLRFSIGEVGKEAGFAVLEDMGLGKRAVAFLPPGLAPGVAELKTSAFRIIARQQDDMAVAVLAGGSTGRMLIESDGANVAKRVDRIWVPSEVHENWAALLQEKTPDLGARYPIQFQACEPGIRERARRGGWGSGEALRR